MTGVLHAMPASLVVDNGVTILGRSSITAGTITFNPHSATGNYAQVTTFTASGTKGLNAGWMIVYPLG